MYRFVVHGRVQGVGFRYFVARRARELGIRGTVRNCPDGTVEVRAAGEDVSLEALVGHLERGPAPARVDRLERFELSLDVEGPDFEITY